MHYSQILSKILFIEKDNSRFCNAQDEVRIDGLCYISSMYVMQYVHAEVDHGKVCNQVGSQGKVPLKNLKMLVFTTF